MNAKKTDRKPQSSDSFVVCGIHPVEEALSMIPTEALAKAELRIADSRQEKALLRILELAETHQLTPIIETPAELSRLTDDTRHQGVVLSLPRFEYADLDAVLDHLSPHPLILVLDQIQDPHNLGAIIRSAAAFGVDAVVITKDRSAQITPTSIKTSAGQAYRVPICRVTNIAQTLRLLKDHDFQVLGADIEGEALTEIDFRPATALVMGSESQGMRRLTRSLCDGMLRIPHATAVESLNVSVACAVIVYQASRARNLGY